MINEHESPEMPSAPETIAARCRAWLRAHRKTAVRSGVIAGTIAVLFAVWLFLVPLGFEWYTGVTNAELTYPNSVSVSDREFERIADDLSREALHARALLVTAAVTDTFTRQTRIAMLVDAPSFRREAEYSHVRYFREAGIRRYEGPATCLRCHEEMTVHNPDGTTEKVNPLDDVLRTVHYRFQSMSGGFTTYGYDGRQVNAGLRGIPVGKIDRACGVPGSFSWTGWAALIKTKPAHAAAHGDSVVMRSEGCGQCHIGGGYHPATEHMMPGMDVPSAVKEGLDCLICHADAYDMDQRYVMEDANGLRWNQDRSIRAALSVGRPTSEMCLRCHQHNMGGDTYEHNEAARSLGAKNPRLLHPGAKRGNPFSAPHDVHAKAGLQCIDCHRPAGHRIPRGNRGTDLVANDLPGVRVDCEMCHTTAPHVRNPLTRVVLNGHVARLACETCHISRLLPTNNVLKDWVHPVWDAEEGMYVPKAVYNAGESGRGFTYLWFNGSGTFLANALGSNPSGGPYNPLMNQMVRIADSAILGDIAGRTTDIRAKYGLDSAAYLAPIADALSQMPPAMRERRARLIEENLRPRMEQGESRLYPFKLFNANMLEDLNNEGPFGAMILPFDYATYFETGNPEASVRKAVGNTIVKRMYEMPFKYYMMDEFMAWFGVGEWTAKYPLDEGNWNVEPRWMRQMGTLMVNHGIEANGVECASCHKPGGIIDFRGLGYSAARVRDLENLPELKHFQSAIGARPAAVTGVTVAR